MAGAWRADKEDAARNPAPNRCEAHRILQEVDDLLHLVLGFVHTGNVLERHRDSLGVDRPRLFKRRDAARHHPEQRETSEAKEDEAKRQSAEAAYS